MGSYHSRSNSSRIIIFWNNPRPEYIKPHTDYVSVGLVEVLPKELTRDEIIEYARKVAREKQISEELFITILLRESGANPKAIGDIDRPWRGCRSRGLFQVNSCYWPEVTDECAFSPSCNINWASDRFREGRVELFTSWNKK